MLSCLAGEQGSRGEREQREQGSKEQGSREQIDPVRAGLLWITALSYIYPNLLPVTAYDRWDRLDMQQKAYGEILQRLEKQRSQQEQRLLPSPISLLDRAPTVLWKGSNLPYHQLAARELNCPTLLGS